MNEKPGWFHISKTSGNKRLARSMLLILCAAISLIFTGAFITYAVLKTVTPTATNVFQSDKNIRIKLDEPQWEDHGRSEALGYVPGQKIDKDPTVTLQADSVDSYVALKVQYYGADNNELTREEFGKLYLNKDKQDEINSEGIDYSYAWEYIGMAADDKGEVYIYKDILSQDSASTVKKENVTEDKEVILNELNTIPGLTATSRYPSMMKEAGIEFADLIDKLIELAMQRTIGAC